jgi:hypothetical protein
VNRRRGLVAAGLAALVVAGMLWADAVTLQRANPSFHDEERSFSKLLHHDAHPAATTTTTSPHPTTTTSPQHAVPAG